MVGPNVNSEWVHMEVLGVSQGQGGFHDSWKSIFTIDPDTQWEGNKWRWEGVKVVK